VSSGEKLRGTTSSEVLLAMVTNNVTIHGSDLHIVS
jgi:hypothetical protein